MDWLTLADQLGQRPDEASLRSAVSRYYYAVFLKSRDTLTAQHLLTPRNQDSDHRDVSVALKQNRRAGAGTALDTLRRLRNDADYDSSLTFAAPQVTRARDLASEVQRLCSQDWARPPT